MKRSIGAILLLLSCLFLSCSESFHNEVCTTLEERLANSDSCSIQLNSVVRFPWDTLHVFWGPIWREIILERYGIKPNTSQISDDQSLYVFVNKGHVVYEEVIQHNETKCDIGSTVDHQLFYADTIYWARKLYAHAAPDNGYHIVLWGE